MGAEAAGKPMERCVMRECRSPFVIAVIVVVSALVWACGDTPTSPSGFASFGQIDLVVGTGADAVSGKTLTVDYTGWLYDASKPDGKGLQFDTTLGRGPFQFVLGGGQVIAGWDQGVPGMKVGGVRRLVIPPSLAYGSIRSGPIPPNATLVFEITLLSVQ